MSETIEDITKVKHFLSKFHLQLFSLDFSIQFIFLDASYRCPYSFSSFPEVTKILMISETYQRPTIDMSDRKRRSGMSVSDNNNNFVNSLFIYLTVFLFWSFISFSLIFRIFSLDLSVFSLELSYLFPWTFCSFPLIFLFFSLDLSVFSLDLTVLFPWSLSSFSAVQSINNCRRLKGSSQNYEKVKTRDWTSQGRTRG